MLEGVFFELRSLPVPGLPLQEKFNQLFLSGLREKSTANGCEHLGAAVVVGDRDHDVHQPHLLAAGIEQQGEKTSKEERESKRLGCVRDSQKFFLLPRPPCRRP